MFLNTARTALEVNGKSATHLGTGGFSHIFFHGLRMLEESVF